MRKSRIIAGILSATMFIQVLPAVAFAEEDLSVAGKAIKAVYNAETETVSLYRTDNGIETLVTKPSKVGYPIVAGERVEDFAVTNYNIEKNAEGVMGAGERMTLTSYSESTGLIRQYTIETSSTEDVIYTQTTYRTGNQGIVVDDFVENEFELLNVEDRVWSFNGGGEGPTHVGDTLLKIDLTDNTLFYRENIQDYRCASIPVSDIYAADGGVMVGDASATRREVRTPVEETNDSVKVSIKWPGKTIDAESTAVVGQAFVSAHAGDYYTGLRNYSNGMEYLGMHMLAAEDIPESSYDLRWESWGWEFDWTIDLIIGELDELQKAGVKQITLDDGWYDNAGDWGLSPTKFPNGLSDVQRLTKAIHDHGMTAIIWWRPCDGGQDSSTLFKEHPEYFVKNADGSTGKLDGAGRFGNFFYGTGYALCPGSAGAIESQVAFINRAMNEWGFDGFKGDYVWSMPKCYDETHNHPYPEDSTERQAEIYKAAREAMLQNNPNAFNLVCNCGVPQDYYGMQYLTQIATADPTSLDQTRRRAKAYKALIGDYFPVTTDHNDIWYPTAVGTGSVLIEKRALTGAAKQEYFKWLDIANKVQLQKGRFIGDLYSYGFDPYETYVVEKDGIMYYAFYRDGNKYRPTGYPDVVLKGLDPNKLYRIVDYVNNKVVATNLSGADATFHNEFSQYLLVKAIEIEAPDPEPVDPDADFTSVDDRDQQVVYDGAWHDDNSDTFYNGSARYTNQVGASVEFSFRGTGIRWYGQKDSNFGTADVYIDNQFTSTVSAYGSMESGVVLYENLNLDENMHTIKIVCKSDTIDVDRFAYIKADDETSFTKVDSMSNQLAYGGTWNEDYNSSFDEGTAKYTEEVGAYVELTFEGTEIVWCGQRDTNFGTARVYIDNELVEEVDVTGEMAAQEILFHKSGLVNGSHVIRIECKAPVIDVDYLAYRT